MSENGVVVVALSPEYYNRHLVDDALSFVPPVEGLDQVAAHDEVERVSFSILFVQLVHQVNSRDAFTVVHLDRTHLDREAMGKELFDGHSNHLQAVLGRAQISFVGAGPARDKPNFFEAQQVYRLRGHLKSLIVLQQPGR